MPGIGRIEDLAELVERHEGQGLEALRKGRAVIVRHGTPPSLAEATQDKLACSIAYPLLTRNQALIWAIYNSNELRAGDQSIPTTTLDMLRPRSASLLRSIMAACAMGPVPAISPDSSRPASRKSSSRVSTATHMR